MVNFDAIWTPKNQRSMFNVFYLKHKAIIRVQHQFGPLKQENKSFTSTFIESNLKKSQNFRKKIANVSKIV